MKTATQARITVSGRQVDYRLIRSKSAKKLRIRVGVQGVEVIQPEGRDGADVRNFVEANGPWIACQLDRVQTLRSIRKPPESTRGTILFRGIRQAVRIVRYDRQGATRIAQGPDGIWIEQSARATDPMKSLENWLRKQARAEIVKHLKAVTPKLRRSPNRVYVMGQRTKWGNCSSLQNLSFNWRLIMAPDFVLRYLVTHEAVHLAVPDHSHKFWLTVKSICPDTEKARQWLSANGANLLTDLRDVCRS